MMIDEFKKDFINFEDAYLNDAYLKNISIEKEYLYFSKFFQKMFITSDYIVITGNYQTVNLELLCRLLVKINNHPILFRLFRYIFGV